MVKALLVVSISAAAAIASAGSIPELLTFDDLTGGYGGDPIEDGYGYLDWDNFWYANVQSLTNEYGPSGYANGLVSGDNVAFNAYGAPATVSDPYSFDLNSGYFTAAWNDGLNLAVQAYDQEGNPIAGDFLLTELNTSGPTFISFDWTDVYSVTFNSYGGTQNQNYFGSGTQFVLDNLNVNVTNVPGPLAAVPFATGLIALVRRRRKA